jgi:uncharacterized protein with HEPN domain
MPDTPDQIRLQHMLDAARKALRWTAGKSRQDLDAEDDPLADGLVRLISLIGEAAGRVSAETRSELDAIPWADIIGMRHRLIHAYFDVNLDILWATVEDSLPPLVESLQTALVEERDD